MGIKCNYFPQFKDKSWITLLYTRSDITHFAGPQNKANINLNPPSVAIWQRLPKISILI